MTADNPYSLPDLLKTHDRKRVTAPQEWQDERRAEILELFRTHVYGRTPITPCSFRFDVVEEESSVLAGKAIRKQVVVTAEAQGQTLSIYLLIYLPVSAREKSVPIFTLLNFAGNHTVESDPTIPIPTSHIREAFLPAEDFRGKRAYRFPIEDIVSRGYGMATAHSGDIDPDFHDGFHNGIHPLLDPMEGREDDAWGAIGAWAWGLSRFMDYFETDACVDHEKVAVLGHSRLGKTALWAAAQDERFSIAISNNSGCTGAALARRKVGESITAINKTFPHWFCDNYKGYDDREDDLPVDQHMLLALIAPRPVYVASATEDLWADPEGEFLSCVHAGPIFDLYGLPDLGITTMPTPEQPINKGHIGYHLRTGKHDLTAYDWRCFMDFAEKHWEQGDS